MPRQVLRKPPLRLLISVFKPWGFLPVKPEAYCDVPGGYLAVYGRGSPLLEMSHKVREGGTRHEDGSLVVCFSLVIYMIRA